MTNKYTMAPIPADIDLKEMYETKNMTIAEMADAIGCCERRVSRELKRIGVCFRKKGARTPKKGSSNGAWKGANATYSAFHHRVAAVRGKPSKCEFCGDEESSRFEWSNLTGKYEDVEDYARLCVSCHKRLDHERRTKTGEMTSMNGSKDGKFRHSSRVILTESQVIEAKQLQRDGWTCNRLGERYGVTAQAMWRVVTGKSWKHLNKRG